MKVFSTFALLAILAIAIMSTVEAQKAYRGAEVRTLSTFQYGKFETRIKASSIKGTV